MSERIKASIRANPTSPAATYNRTSVLGDIIVKLAGVIASQVKIVSSSAIDTSSKLAGAIASQANTIEQFSSTNLDLCSATRLMTLHRALQTQNLSQLGSETQRILAPSTINTIESLENSLGNGQLSQTLTQIQLSSALKDMTKAVQKAHQVLALREQKEMRDDLCSIFKDRGYTVRIEGIETGQSIWIRAKKAEQVIAARIADNGTFDMDMAGFKAGKCTQERETIVQQLEGHGYQVHIDQRVAHNRRDGGSIVREIEKGFQQIDDRLRRLNLAKAQRSRSSQRRS